MKFTLTADQAMQLLAQTVRELRHADKLIDALSKHPNPNCGCCDINAKTGMTYRKNTAKRDAMLNTLLASPLVRIQRRG